MSEPMERDGVESLSALRAFVRVAESKSFTDAGRQLNLSSSAVTKSISRLEDRLGVRLLHRNTRHLSLTQEGEVFLESCRKILSEIEFINTELANVKSVPQGKLKVSLPMVGMLMMPVISDFMAAYPQIQLDLHFTDLLVNVIDDGYDVVVRTGDGADSRLVARGLGSYRLQVVGSPEYLARAGIPLTPEDLLRHACLHHRYPTTGRLQRWPLEGMPDAGELALPVSASATTIEPLITLAERGNGLACVPDFAIREQLATGRLVVVLDDVTRHAGTFRAVWPSNRFVPPKLRAFVDYLAEHLFAAPDNKS
jgi:DNA-binding transcriptional LysR family regulator